MSGVLERRLPAIWFYGAVAICAFLVGATVLRALGPETGPTAFLLARFGLTLENNLAAWWAGMLLALVSLHAFDGHTLLRRREPGAAAGWALLAALLLILSADEVGSIHERVSGFGRSLGIGAWRPLLPFAVVLLAMLGGALVLLWRAEGQRSKVGPLLVGFLFLGSGALHELVEHSVDWPTAGVRAARAAAEEGSELLGALILLKVAMGNTAGLLGRAGAGDRPVFEALLELRRPLIVLGLALAPVLAVITAALPDQQRGHPADWLAAVAFLAAGLAVCRRFVKGGGAIDGLTWGLSALCCLASATVVAVPPGKLVGAVLIEVELRMLVLAVIGLLISSAWILAAGNGRRTYPPGAAVFAVFGPLVALTLVSTNLVLVYVLPQLLGLVVYFVNSKAAEEQPERIPALGTQGGSGFLGV